MPDPTNVYGKLIGDSTVLSNEQLETKTAQYEKVIESIIYDLGKVEEQMELLSKGDNPYMLMVDDETAEARFNYLTARLDLLTALMIFEGYNRVMADLNIQMHPYTLTPEAIVDALGVAHESTNA